MAVEKRVLVVTPTASVARALTAAVLRLGYVAVVVKNFTDAKKQLATLPHLLITELKLGEFNGLQLALRAMSIDIPAVVVADSSFEHEVEQLGAYWSSPDLLQGDGLQNIMVRLVQGAGDSGFWGDTGFESGLPLRPPSGGAQLH
jgi:CheY-like chemotaxis protein